MGDKSPKAKDKAKKQDTAGKSQKKAAASAKQKVSSTVEKKVKYPPGPARRVIAGVGAGAGGG